MVGCLSLSKWMMDRGARHFVFLGRSGLDKTAARNQVEDLEAERRRREFDGGGQQTAVVGGAAQTAGEGQDADGIGGCGHANSGLDAKGRRLTPRPRPENRS